MKIDFIIIGAQKSGTTSLSEQLTGHSQICFCKIKEPAYFNTAPDWKAGLNDYHHLYSPSEGQLCGEASTSYTFLPEYPDTHLRLFEYNPELKLIYIMRNPVERIISHYAHRLALNRITEPPEFAVFSDSAYLNRSRYSLQISPYRALFGKENVLLLIFEDYIANPYATLKQVANFLNISVEAFETIDDRPRNQSGTKPEFPRKVKEKLWQILEEDFSQIEEILSRRLDVWRSGI